MSELLERLKAYYTASKSNSFEWHDYYPNNMPDNGKEGSYTFFWFKKKDKFEFLKYTINYMSRCDEEGCSHPEEGTKYYVLHEDKWQDLKSDISTYLKKCTKSII